jgi:hypothetical protein
VRFRVELRGRLWKCITGDWIFDVGFTPIGREGAFLLSGVLPDPNLKYPDWRGCDRLCIERIVTVPPGTIKLNEGEDTVVFQVAAKVELRCCDGHVAVSGFEPLKEYQFFRGA